MTTTAQDLINTIRFRMNIPSPDGYSGLFADTELIPELNYSLAAAYDTVVESNQMYRMVRAQITLTTNGDGYNLITLPSDMYKFKGISRQYGSRWLTLTTAQYPERNMYSPPFVDLAVGTMYVHYYIEDNFINILPFTNSAGTYQIDYYPTWTDLALTTDSIPPFMDHRSWLEYVIADMCVKILQLQEQDFSLWEQKRQMAERHLVSITKTRDVGGIIKSVDVRHNDRWRGGYGGSHY